MEKIKSDREMQKEIESDRMKSEKEIELEKIKSEKEDREMQMKIEMERIKSEKEVRLKQAEMENNNRTIDSSDKNFKYVPEFVEGEEEDFFLQFEKNAKLRNWDESEWALLVQSKFKGKA